MLIIANITGWFVANWRLLLYVLGGVALLIVFGLVMKSCNRPPKLDEKAIQKAQQAIAEKDREAMTKILVESDVAEKQIDKDLANADNEKLKALDEARKKARQMTNDELAAELERRLNQ